MDSADVFGLRNAWMESRQTARDCIDEQMELCIEAAAAEAEYYKTKYSTMVRLKAEGNFNQTFIADFIKGVPEVAEKLMAHRMASLRYQAAKQATSYYTNEEAHLFKEYSQAMEGR